jgi:hypothetical protein
VFTSSLNTRSPAPKRAAIPFTTGFDWSEAIQVSEYTKIRQGVPAPVAA